MLGRVFPNPSLLYVILGQGPRTRFGGRRAGNPCTPALPERPLRRRCEPNSEHGDHGSSPRVALLRGSPEGRLPSRTMTNITGSYPVRLNAIGACASAMQRFRVSISLATRIGLVRKSVKPSARYSEGRRE